VGLGKRAELKNYNLNLLIVIGHKIFGLFRYQILVLEVLGLSQCPEVPLFLFLPLLTLAVTEVSKLNQFLVLFL